MGKKHKKNKGNWGMSESEQVENMELFNRLMDGGDITILDICNHKSAPSKKSKYGPSDIAKQLQAVGKEIIEREQHENPYNVEPVEEEEYTENESIGYSTSEPDVESEEMNEEDSIAAQMNRFICEKDDDAVEETEEEIEEVRNEEFDTVKEVEEVVETEEPKHCNTGEGKTERIIGGYTIPMIHAKYDDMTGRVIIDDEAIATAISPIYTNTLQLNSDRLPMDEDEYNTVISQIFFYIVSCKHPTVIMTEDTFEIEFGIFNTITSSRVTFFRYKGYIFIYVLDEDVIKNFYSVKEIFNMDDEAFIRYMVGSAYTASNMNNRFMKEDEDEIDSVMNYRHDIKKLIAYIEKEFNVEYSGHNISSDVYKTHHVVNLENFEANVRAKMDDFILADDEDEEDYEMDDYDYKKVGEDDEEDEDEDEDDESDESESDNNDDVDVNDFPDVEDVKVYTDDIDDMMDKIDPVEELISRGNTVINETEKSATPTNNSTGNDMSIPVYHKQNRR